MSAPTSGPLPGVPPSIALINGPVLLGNLFGYMFYGILLMQIFVYSSRFKKDPRWIKALVWGIFAVDTIMTVLFTIAAWMDMASGWGDLSTLNRISWPFNVLPILSGLVTATVHAFFCWRIWRLTKIWTLPLFIMALSATSWGMSSFCGITAVTRGPARVGELRVYVIVWLCGSTLADTLVTATMVFILFRAGARSAFRETSSMVSKLIVFTVETGMTPAMGAVLELIFFFAFPHTSLYFLPFNFLAKLYSNTLLATLNARDIFQRGTEPAIFWDNDDISFGTTSGASSKMPSTGIQITTDTTQCADHEMRVPPNGRRELGNVFPNEPHSPYAFENYSPNYQTPQKRNFIETDSTTSENDASYGV